MGAPVPPIPRMYGMVHCGEVVVPFRNLEAFRGTTGLVAYELPDPTTPPRCSYCATFLTSNRCQSCGAPR